MGKEEAIAACRADRASGASLECQCPFCPGQFVIPPPDAAHGVRYVMHTMPFCKVFERSDPAEFLQQVNEERARLASQPSPLKA